jgi:hypothetical protein
LFNTTRNGEGHCYDFTSKNSASRYLPRSVEPFFLVSPLGILHFAL